MARDVQGQDSWTFLADVRYVAFSSREYRADEVNRWSSQQFSSSSNQPLLIVWVRLRPRWQAFQADDAGSIPVGRSLPAMLLAGVAGADHPVKES
jgi:hypothetical protein